MVTDEEAEKALHWLRANIGNAAKARAERSYLEEYSKVLRAMIMKEHTSLSAAAQEREAYADPRYLTHIEGLKKAIENDCRMTFARGAAEAVQDAWRTQAATERAMKL